MSPPLEKHLEVSSTLPLERPEIGVPKTTSLVLGLNSLFVSLYKFFGFLLLLAIVIGMAAYLCANAFYHLSHRWIVPEILSPQHEKVVRDSMHFLEQKYELRKLQVEQVEMQGELSVLEKNLEGKAKFQEAFSQALKSEQAVHSKFLDELKEVRKDLSLSTPQAVADIRSLSAEEQKMLRAASDSNLLDRKEILDRKSWIATLEMSLLERRQKLADIRRMIGVGTQDQGGAASLQKIRNEKDLFESSLESYSLSLKKGPIEQKLKALTDLVGAYEASVNALEASPFVQASRAPVLVAFAPYDNLANVQQGSKIYGCYLGFVICKRVGSVVEVLAPESTGRHPFTTQDLRGKHLRIELDDPSWGEEKSLVINRPPFFF